MSFKSEILEIPEAYLDVIPCQTNPELYTTKDLDVEFDDNENVDLSVRKQKLAAKALAEKKAVNACLSCVMINECRTWSLSTDVFGVAGGLTQRERNKIKRSNQAQLLGSPPVANRVETAKAKKAINFAKVSKETLAIYDLLSDGEEHSRDNVIEKTRTSVPKKMALQFAKTNSETVKDKIENGSRRLLLNRIDIGVRRGRINSQKIGNNVMLTLDPEVLREYRNWIKNR